jgi:hypothetical protein
MLMLNIFSRNSIYSQYLIFNKSWFFKEFNVLTAKKKKIHTTNQKAYLFTYH